MNLKQWMMQASPIITAPPPATTTTNQLYKGNTLYTSLEEHKRTDETNAVKSTNTDFGIIKSPYDNTKSLKVMLYVTTHMSPQHIWYLKSCWFPALQNSLLLCSSDVVAYLNPANDTLQEEAKKLLKGTFQNQKITIHDHINPGKEAGAKAALEDAAKEGWFKGYDWVIWLNPDVIIRNDTYILDVMQNDLNATAILINCAHFNPQKPKVHTDFFAIKPGVLAPNTFINSTIGNAELSFTNDISADIMNKGNHRWIKIMNLKLKEADAGLDIIERKMKEMSLILM